MIRFNCPSCNKLYSFAALPVPESGAEFLCARCNSKCLIQKNHGEIKVTLLSSPDSEEGEVSQQVFDSFSQMERESYSPDEIERRLQGLICEMPIGISYVLGVLEGPDQGLMYKIEDPSVTIGKTGCDINLTDTNISREHCSIKIYGQNFVVLRDLDSTWGTFKNGEQISIAVLQAGDKIQVGKTTLSFIQNSKN